MQQVLNNLIAGLPPGLAGIVGTWVAAFLTLMVLSYLFGNNPFFRLAQYLFIGVAAGYAVVLAWNQVLWPRLQLLFWDPLTYWYYGVFFVLGLMLLARESRVLSVLGNLPLGVLFGVGAALALGGALTGSLIPQLRATVLVAAPMVYESSQDVWLYALDAIVLVLGTVAVLSATHFTAPQGGIFGRLIHGTVRALGTLGRGLLMVTFGALFASALLSFFALLNSRLVFLVNSWLKLFGNAGL